MKNKLYFLAPWNLILGFCIGCPVFFLLDLIEDDAFFFGQVLDISEIWHRQGVLISLFAVVFWLLGFAYNLYRYRFLGKRNFESNTDISKDKLKAMYPTVPRRYLSKRPDGFTLGRYKNTYFRLPIDLHDVKHTLIIGAPGSMKSTSIMDSLIWNFNFEEKKLDK